MYYNNVVAFKQYYKIGYEMAMHRKTLRDNGIKLLSAMENIPDSPEGIIFESLLEGFEHTNGHNNKVRIKAANSM